MTFANGILVFGAAAFAIPLILHILNRSRFKTIEWGAMHLLESVIKVNHKRFQIEQLLLLLVRCSIPVLLALCLARPVFTGWKALAGDAPTSIVILLDNSYSMSTLAGDGERFSKAVQAATDVLKAAPRGSEFAVILMGGAPQPVFSQPVFDAEPMIRQLKSLEAAYGACAIQESLDAGLVTLSQMSHARRELIIISDFQPADWQPLMTVGPASLQTQLAALPVKPVLSYLPVGHPATRNISVESLEFSHKAVSVGQQFSVRANLKNQGADSQQARVVLLVDGIEEAVSQVPLEAQGSTQALLTCRFESPGSHVLKVDVATADDLLADNGEHAAITVWDRIPVLLVDGDPSREPLKSETDFLSVALTPFTFGRLRLVDLVETNTITQNELKADRLEGMRVVVLANTSKLSDEQLQWLTTYVQGGGALVITAGNRVDVDWSRETFFAQGNGLLPLPWGELQGAEADASTAENSTRIVAQRFDHPALQLFNDRANGDLSTATIRRWYRLPLQEHPAPTELTVLARLGTGEPLLVERSRGEGVVVQMATACDADWSDLPLRPVYVPLMQQLVTHLATRWLPPQNLQTGDTITALFAESDESEITVTVPGGFQRTQDSIVRGKNRVAEVTATQRPGVYSLTSFAGETQDFAVSTSRSESQLALMDETQLQQLADDSGGAVYASSASYLAQERLRRHGQEIWQLMLAAVLFMMFLEMILQQKFSRVHL